MDQTSKRLFLLALLAALVASGGIYMHLSTLENMAITRNTDEVVVATKDIPARVAITRDMVEMIRMPKGSRHPHALSQTSEVIGLFTTQPLILGEQILTDRLFASTAESGLSFILNTGYRALSVRIDDVIAVAHQVRAGDFVDVVVSYDQPDEANTPTASLLLQNIRVLAVGAEMTLGAKSSTDSVTMTLEVKPQQAERLVYAEDYGKIRLLLRPVADNSLVTPTYTTGHNLIDR